MQTQKITKAIEEITHDLVMPYYERWKRGRPSKLQRERRQKHYEWMKENMHRFPHLDMILNNRLEGCKLSPEGTVTMRYKPRVCS